MSNVTLTPITGDSSPVQVGARLWLDDRRNVVVIAPPVEGGYLAPDASYFLVQWDYTGLIQWARLTGKTRNGHGWAMPTADRFEVVTTVAEVEGVNAIVGVVGKRIPGRISCYADRLVAR
jgi:hypothetical protein